MNNSNRIDSFTHAARRALGPILAMTMLSLAAAPAAAEELAEDATGWSFNFTPVLVFASGDYRLGGGADPEVKYTVELGQARLSAGARLGVYYARNLVGVTVMPTLRLSVPIGPVEPYAAAGMGYGWLPKIDHEDLASMARFGVIFHFSESFAVGIESTMQKIDGSDFRFPSFGSVVSIDL